MTGVRQPARQPLAVAEVLARAAALLGATFTNWVRSATGADDLVHLVTTAEVDRRGDDGYRVRNSGR